MELKNTAVVVTGASRGLGLELSRALAREGARVVLVARGAEELDAAVRLVNADAQATGAGGAAHGLAFDVGDKLAIHRIAGAASALVGNVELLVHAASTLGPLPMPLLLDTDCEDLQRVLEVNLIGPFRLTKALAGSMVMRQRGMVLFVSSDAAVSAYANWGAYGISKAAQDHLARSLAAEHESVRFLSIDPGEMDTRMHADALPDADRSALAQPAVVAARLLRIIRGADSLPNGARLEAAHFAADLDTGAAS